MKTSIVVMLTMSIILVVGMANQNSFGQQIPDWVKNNAGWWADGQIDNNSFVQGIQYLISTGVITIPSQEMTQVQNNSAESSTIDSQLAQLEANLAKCEEIIQNAKRIDCEKIAKSEITTYTYKKDAHVFQVGPINYYWKGLGSDGNIFEISPTGQAILSIRMLAENTRGTDNVSLMCTGPAICNYDMWDGQKAFKYSGTDFTNGNIVLKPGQSREFNIVFGPNIGYGGTKFEYYPEKTYVFRIQEPWGSTSITIPISQ